VYYALQKGALDPVRTHGFEKRRTGYGNKSRIRIPNIGDPR